MNNVKVVVIKNEAHSMMEEQLKILGERFESYEILQVPSSGWTLEEQFEKAEELSGHTIVFVSPVPVLLSKLAFMSGYADKDNCINANGPLKGIGTKVFVFHNDNRDKKEIPGGKIIQVVAQTGWKLVDIGW